MVIGLPPDGLTPAWERDFAAYPPAGVIVFRRDFRDLAALRTKLAHLRALARPRRLFFVLDEEGGWVSQLAGHLVVPPNAGLLARSATAADFEYLAGVTARRLRALGFDWNFAPVADVHSEPDNPVIGPRAYGTKPEQVTDAVAAVLRGFRAHGLASCLKHFPGHGDTRTDSHVTLPVCDLGSGLLERREMAPFAANLDADSVMTAHVLYRKLDSEQPGTYSRTIATRLLRDQLGFRGVCVTDALEMEGAAAGRTPAEAGAAALSAGCDLLLYAHWNEEVRRARLQLADLLVAEKIDRMPFDASRPRLMHFDTSRPEPTDAELATPLDALTPPDFVARLTALVDAGLRVEGTLPAVARTGDWAVHEPEFAHGGTLAADLVAAGVPQGGASPSAQVIAVCSRKPLADAEIAALRTRCAERPTMLVGLQNDAFLAQVSEAAVTLSAADATPLVRARVAERLAALRRGERA
ncbi:MAG: glycoside hydrolase family 3 N-terminal domain-containing protein [Candidatus Eisenbacteria bacterium]